VSARGTPGVLALPALCSLACLSVHYQARQSTRGDPASPAAHAERVAIRDLHDKPGEAPASGATWVRPRVTRAGLETTEIASEIDRTLVLSVRIAAGPRAEIVAMTWSPPSAPRCSGGHPALAILTDAEGELNSTVMERPQVRWERPVVLQGEQVLSGRFDEDPPLLHQDSVVDIRLATYQAGVRREDCIRVPMTGAGVTYWNLKHWSLGGRVSWRRALPSTHSSVLLLGLSLGRWWGPVRIGVEGLVGGTADSSRSDGAPDPDGPSGTGLCFLASGPDCDTVTLGAAALEASGIGWRWTRWAIGWSVAYETSFASLLPVHRWAIAGGPRLALQLLRAVPDIAGVSRFSPTSAWGVELYAAAGQQWKGAAAGTPVTYGVSLLGF
jgi:hypothetical protein